MIASLKAHGLKPIPLTGQDATPTGVQFILAGDQSGTVYKSVRKEADAAANAAIAIVKGQPVQGVNGTVSGTKSILLTPVWITKKNYKLLFDDGFLKKSEVCTGQLRPVLQLSLSSTAGAPCEAPRPLLGPSRVDERGTSSITFRFLPYSCPPSAVPRKERQ